MLTTASHPYLRHDLRLVARNGDQGEMAVFLQDSHVVDAFVGDREAKVFANELLAYADGSKSVHRIAETVVRESILPESVLAGFRMFYEVGLVADLAQRDGTPPEPAMLPLLRSWATRTSNPADLLATVRKQPIAVVGDGDFATLLTDTLTESGFSLCYRVSSRSSVSSGEDGGIEPSRSASCEGTRIRQVSQSSLLPMIKAADGPLLIVLTRAMLDVAVALHDAGTKASIPVLCFHVTGDRCLMGPLVTPGETACLRCRQFADGESSVSDDSHPPTGTPAFTKAAAALAAGFVIEALAFPDRHPLRNRTACWEPLSLRLMNRSLFRDPECPVCSRRAGYPEGAAISLEN